MTVEPFRNVHCREILPITTINASSNMYFTYGLRIENIVPSKHIV